MVLSELTDYFFSNDQEEPTKISFPQGAEFIKLQKGKIMRYEDHANRLIDPNGFSTDHTLYGQRALGGTSFNMDSNLKLIEGFNTASTIGSGSKRSDVAQQNIDDKQTRQKLTKKAEHDAIAYKTSVNELVDAAKQWGEKTHGQLPTLTYVAQSIQNPLGSHGSSKIGQGYIRTKSKLGNGAPAEGTAGITCAAVDAACVRKCQVRTYDDGGVGFTLDKDPDNNVVTCSPIMKPTELTTLTTQIQKAETEQLKNFPKGEWINGVQPGTVPVLEGQVLYAMLETKDSSPGHYVPARVVLPSQDPPTFKYSNNDGKFRLVLTGSDALSYIDGPWKEKGITDPAINANILQATYKGQAMASVAVDVDDYVDIKDGKFIVTQANPPSIPAPSEQYVYRVNYGGAATGTPNRPINKSLMGTLHYVDTTGIASLNDAVTTDWKTGRYNQIGNYNIPGGGGSPVDSGSTSSDCQKKCTNKDGCRGYVFGKATTENKITSPPTCYLMTDKDWPNAARIYDKNYQMSLQVPQIANMPTGCPTNVLVDSAASLQDKNTSDFPTQGCGVGKILADKEKKIKTKNQQLGDTQTRITQEMLGLVQDDNTLQKELSSSLDKLKSGLSEYQDINDKARSASGNLTHADATSEDTKLQLISENYHYLIWSILAIALVIGGIRASRN